MAKTRLCVVAMGDGTRAEAIAKEAKEKFHVEPLMTDGIRGATNVLGNDAYDVVIIDGIANVRDGWVVAIGVGTSKFRHFNGWAWRGTGRGTPVFMIVPPEERVDVHGITNVSVLEDPVETEWFMRRLGELGFSRRVPIGAAAATTSPPVAAPVNKEPVSAF